METVVNEDGLRVRAYVKIELESKRQDMGRLPSKFPVRVHEDFDLDSGVFDALLPPPDSKPKCRVCGAGRAVPR